PRYEIGREAMLLLLDQQRSGRCFRLLVRNGVAWHHNGGHHRYLA
ncbi:hypothetical protein Q604_UNBC01511G0001, partial [human gut metagenome]